MAHAGVGVSRPLVVVTGATGFIGSAVLARLSRRPVRIRAVARNPAPGAAAGQVQWVRGDLSEPGSLRAVCEGADALVHAASYVGPDRDLCEAVNVRGGAALAAEAAACRVPRVIALSTAAVYGPGPHRGLEVEEAEPAPVSAASRSRLAAEQFFLAVGAVVLRPGLILGAGDRWVVPALAELARRVPARWDGGRARLSAVEVTDLARLVVDLLRPGTGPGGTVYHASHPVPLTTAGLMDALGDHGLVPPLRGDRSWPACLEQLASAPGQVTPRQFHLLAQDHWHRSDRVWQVARCAPGPGPLARLGEAAAWYRPHLLESAMPG